MFDTGVESPLDELLASVRSVVAGIGVDGLEAPIAARVVEQCAEAERRLAALRVMATATLRDKALWRREGFRSAAAWMASKTGTSEREGSRVFKGYWRIERRGRERWKRRITTRRPVPQAGMRSGRIFCLTESRWPNHRRWISEAGRKAR